MELIINNHIIDTDVEDILLEIRRLTDGYYLQDIRRRSDDVAITCPFHKFGKESHPSCYVYNKNDADFPFGYFRCFTCGEKGPLYKLVAHCLNMSYEEAKQWLVDNFSNTFSELSLNLPEITLGSSKKVYLDESILNEYAYIHPYILKRGITEEVVKRFNVGWNEKNNSITFPVRDEHGGLIGITERMINRKQFLIPEGMEKPVYLLYYIKQQHIDEVYVCESQINALTLHSMGYPAVALFGTGSREQYEILRKSGIRKYHLCLDGDLAGRHGNIRFIENMPNSVLIDVVKIPNGKDVNDLNKEEFDLLERIDKSDYIK